MLPAARVTAISTVNESQEQAGRHPRRTVALATSNQQQRAGINAIAALDEFHDVTMIVNGTRAPPSDAYPPSSSAAVASQAAPPPAATGGSNAVSPPNQDPSPALPQQASAAAEEELEPPIEDVVNRAIIHADKLIEHLPLISPPELKLIGRCVTFVGDTTIDGQRRTFFYEGLVATINKETVMLIHVHRYTEEDFQVHKLQLRQAAGMAGGKMATGGSEDGDGLSHGDPDWTGGASVPAGATREEQEAHRRFRDEGVAAVGAEEEDISQQPNGADFDFDPTRPVVTPQSTEAVDLLNDLGETHAEATIRVRNRMRGHHGSMGPIPYVTFSRAKIHRVEFGRDPRSSFYSLFCDPAKQYLDMQCLRMFVRRYLIHTSQGNNPRKVPLRAFITCRCSCPDLDNDLLTQTTREELGHLVKIDRDARRAKQKKEQGRRNVLRAYRAPNGMFRNTGVLFLTHLPRQTFSIGVIEVMVMLAVLVYEITAVTSMEISLVLPYIVKLYPYFYATVVVAIMASSCTLFHSVRMCIPILDQLYLIFLRALFTFGTVACSIMTMIVAGEMCGIPRWTRYYQTKVPQERLCYFYAAHQCSGLSEPCTGSAFGTGVCQCSAFMSPSDYFSTTCDRILLAYIQRAALPVVCMSFLVFVTYLFDGYLHLRLFHVARLLERRM